MELSLAENIRTYRKQRRLTQEQFAEVLGVTTGAVYKWESGQSVPELNLIVEMAGFFDTSVDALLGYQMRDNGPAAFSRRLVDYCKTRDPRALTEAEQALKKYPNSFDIVLRCANVFIIYGTGEKSGARLRRALELLEQSLLLIGQNKEPKVNELTIYSQMASAYLALGEAEKAVELLKAHNAELVFSDAIGSCLAIYMNRPEEAETYLSEAILVSVAKLLSAIGSYVVVYHSRQDDASALEILGLALTLMTGFWTEDAQDFMIEALAEIYGMLACTQKKLRDDAGALASLEKAAEQVRRFDATPVYTIDSMRFIKVPDTVSIQSEFGDTARECVERGLQLLGDTELQKLWEEVSRRGE